MGVVERGRLPRPVARLMNRARANALRLHVVPGFGVFGAAAVDALDELLDGSALPEARRQGIRRASCPATANVLVVCGLGRRAGDADGVLEAYHAMPHPKYVVLVVRGEQERDDASGLALDLIATAAGGDPTPLGILRALGDLQRWIRDEDPAERWLLGPERPAAPAPAAGGRAAPAGEAG